MACPNLKAEMARTGVTSKQVAEISGIHETTVSQKLNDSDTSFSIKQAHAIRDAFFPDYTIDYLFDENAILPASNEVS